MPDKKMKYFIPEEVILENLENSDEYAELIDRQHGNNINVDTKDVLVGMCSALSEAIKREGIDGSNIYNEICKKLMRPIGYFEFFADVYNQQFEKLKNDGIYGKYFLKNNESVYNVDPEDIYEFMSSSTVGSKPPEQGYFNYEDISSKEQLIKTIYLSNRASKIVSCIDDVFIDEAVSEYLKNTKTTDYKLLHEKIRKFYRSILDSTLLTDDFKKKLVEFKKVSASYYQNPVDINSYKSTNVYRFIVELLKEKLRNTPSLIIDKTAINITPELLYKHFMLGELSNNFYLIKDSRIKKLIEEYLQDIKNIKEEYAGNEKMMEKMLNKYKSNLRITYDGDAVRMSENKRYSSVVNIAHRGYNSPVSFHVSLVDIPKIEKKIGESLEYGSFNVTGLKKGSEDYSFQFRNNLFFKYSSYQAGVIMDIDKEIAEDEERTVKKHPAAILKIMENRRNSVALPFFEDQKRMLTSLQKLNLEPDVPIDEMKEKLNNYRENFSGTAR